MVARIAMATARTRFKRRGRKAVERKLRQSEKRYKKLLQRVKPKQLKTVVDDLNTKHEDVGRIDGAGIRVGGVLGSERGGCSTGG